MNKKSALENQVGGLHYKGMRCQPVKFASDNNLTGTQLSVIKYLTRHHIKNGVEDLEKAMHFCDLASELDDYPTYFTVYCTLTKRGCDFLKLDGEKMAEISTKYVEDNGLGLQHNNHNDYIEVIFALLSVNFKYAKTVIEKIIEKEYKKK